MNEDMEGRLKRLEEEKMFLRSRLQELEQGSRKACDQIFSVVSHEMRTPLTAILGFSEYLLKNEVGQELQHELVSLIVKQSERLKNLIDNLLTLQRMEAGFALEETAPVILPDLLHQVARGFHTPLVRQEIEVDCSPDLPPIFGDSAKIQHALANLLGNAIKYSPSGSRIVLGARGEGDHVLLWVRDEGPGIPVDEQEKIFDRFYRVEGRNHPLGTGLGLAIVKEIAEAHGGRVWVGSSAGRGSTFFLSLPLAR